MNELASQLCERLNQRGWTFNYQRERIMFTKEDVSIVCYQEHVTVECGSFHLSETSSRFVSNKERLMFLIEHTEQFARLVDSGELYVMKRWHTALETVRQTEWEKLVQQTGALELFEKAVTMIVK